MASYLDARSHGGLWLLRMEDLDTPRLAPGAADAILRTLERHGLDWDQAPLYQSARLPAYAAALDALRVAGRLYACDCSRKDLDGAYPGTCRDRRHEVSSPHALRLRLNATALAFRDRWQGERHYDPAALGDPVLRRRDGLFAYQLAVVVDDVHQGVTDVVRGGDLLDSTPWQLAILDALGKAAPRYAHAPVVTEPDGHKLAKSRRSIALDSSAPGANLHEALTLLGQSPPAGLAGGEPHEVLSWARMNWNSQALENRAEIAAREMFGSGSPLVIR